ncbi:MAG: hypothetical protein KBC15_03620 [Candidatus Levybacteria bacterium]|nr:hypothetical protein [Candidatus Levybacteria bacterium]
MAQDLGNLQEKNESRVNIARATLGNIDRATTAGEQAALMLQEAAEHDEPMVALVSKPVSSAEKEDAFNKSFSWSWKEEKDSEGRVVGYKQEKVMTTETKDRYEAADKSFKFAQDFLKKGFVAGSEGMTAAEMDIYREAALNSILKLWPEAEQAMEGVGQAEREQMMDRMLRSPLFSEKMKEALQTAVDFGKKGKEIDPELVRKKTEAELELQRLADKKKSLEALHGHSEVLFIPGSIATEVAAGKNMDHEYDVLGVDIEDLDNKAKLAAIKAKAARTRASQYKNAADVLDRNRENDSADAFEIEAAGFESEAKKLTAKRKDIEAYRKSLSDHGSTESHSQDQLDELEHKMRLAQTNLLRIQADYNLAKLESDGHEAAFASKLKGVPETAVRAYLEDMTRKYEQAREALIKQNGDEQLSKGLADRWNFRSRSIGRGKTGELNKDAVRQDYKDLVSNGPDAVVIRTLMAGGMGYDEAKAKLESDESFAKRARHDVVERLLTRQFQSGKITTAELERITDNKEWGGPELIRRAIENRAQYLGNQDLETLKAAGLHSSEFAEKVKALPKNRLIQLLLLLLVVGTLTIDALGGFGLVTAATKGVVAVGSAIGHGAGSVVSGVSGAVDTAITGGKDYVDQGSVGVNSGWGSMASTGGDISAGATDLGSTVISGASSAGVDVMSGAKDVTPGILSNIKTGAVDVAPSIGGAVNRVASGAADVVSDATLTDATKVVGGTIAAGFGAKKLFGLGGDGKKGHH